MINPCDFFSRAEAAPLKSPCDQRERGRERAYEQSECAKVSVAEAVRAERTTSDVEAKAEVERERAWRKPCERPRVRPEEACGYGAIATPHKPRARLRACGRACERSECASEVSVRADERSER